MLYFLSSDNKYHRILRRGIVVGVLSCLAVMIYDYLPTAPESIIPLLTILGVMIDKAVRELMPRNRPSTE